MHLSFNDFDVQWTDCIPIKINPPVCDFFSVTKLAITFWLFFLHFGVLNFCSTFTFSIVRHMLGTWILQFFIPFLHECMVFLIFPGNYHEAYLNVRIGILLKICLVCEHPVSTPYWSNTYVKPFFLQKQTIIKTQKSINMITHYLLEEAILNTLQKYRDCV